MIRSAFLVLSGNAAGSLLSFARNLVVARLIPVEDFGVAATLALVVAIVEMVSALGLQQQIVQARDGDDPRFQAALQGFQVLRGVLSGLALLLLAGPFARFMGVPEATWGYRAMALVPVLNALVHFDVYRLSRAMRFGPGVVAGVAPGAASLAAAWPLALWLGDWRAMLGAILLGSALGALASHLVAERPYRLTLDRDVTLRALRFGWPLLVNNALLFLVFNGNRALVGRELGMAALGIFSMGLTMTLTPTLVLAKSIQSLFLPRLSALDREAPGGEERFQALARATLETGLANGLLMAVAVSLLGGPFVFLVLGEHYAPLVPILAVLSAAQALRVFKTGSAVVALSQGRTGNALAANLVRVAALPLAWAVLIGGGGLEAAVLVGVAGEALGFALSLALVRATCGLRLRPLLAPLLLAAVVLVVISVHGLPQELRLGLPVVLALGLAAGMNDLRRLLWDALSRRRRR